MTRKDLVAVLEDVLREGDTLIEKGLEVTLVASETIMLGARAVNARAIRVLADYHVDDQVAVIVRSLVEAAVDVEYLNTRTVRRLGGDREVELTPDIKSLLFSSHKPVALFNIVTEAEELEPDDPLPDEIAANLPEGIWDRVREARTEALQMRERLGLRESPYWACAGSAAMMAELRRALPEEAGRLRQHRRFFQDFSFFAHANPNDTPYVVQPSGKLRSSFREDSILGAAVIAAVEVYRWWGVVLGDEMRPRFIGYLRRLGGEAPDL